MAEDVGGTPFPDGGGPDDDQNRGTPDDEFAPVVFDEDFVRAAPVHEPTAVERLVAAAQARAEASEAEAARRARAGGPRPEDDRHDEAPRPDDLGLAHDPLTHGHLAGDPTRPGDPGGHPAGHVARTGQDPSGPGPRGGDAAADFAPGLFGRPGGSVRPGRWHRPVAWVLALVMGMGMVALAFTAVQRGAAGQTGQVPPPVSTRPTPAPAPDTAVGPSASAEYSRPPAPAVPRASAPAP
ncbi:SCO2584 family spore wall biosynthesis protein [Streptomyces abyssomicinicus]|uniref:SCO2584 family spore wall biosynthesis protein n=1 Tax=Streptomyces abyssomicinicus TaxID=574929 RepID=UPI00124FB9B8